MNEKHAKKVRFYELDGENKLTAISQMLSFKKKNDWPYGANWKNEEDIRSDLEQDYNPDDHFSF